MIAEDRNGSRAAHIFAVCATTLLCLVLLLLLAAYVIKPALERLFS